MSRESLFIRRDAFAEGGRAEICYALSINEVCLVSCILT